MGTWKRVYTHAFVKGSRLSRAVFSAVSATAARALGFGGTAREVRGIADIAMLARQRALALSLSQSVSLPPPLSLSRCAARCARQAQSYLTLFPRERDNAFLLFHPFPRAR